MMADRKGSERVVVVVQREPKLLQVVLALRAPRGLTCLLNCRKEQRDEDGDNGDDDEELDQSERSRRRPGPDISGMGWRMNHERPFEKSIAEECFRKTRLTARKLQ